MGTQNIGVFLLNNGGTRAALNVTAAGGIKTASSTSQAAGSATPGRVAKIIVSVAPTSSGAITLNDTETYTAANTITAITAVKGAVVTVSTGGTANPFVVGQTISFTSVGGMTQINGVLGKVTAIGGTTTAWTITTNIDASAFSAFTSGGTCASFSITNQIFSLAFGSVTAGQVIALDVPFTNGLILSAVGGGTPVYTITYQ